MNIHSYPYVYMLFNSNLLYIAKPSRCNARTASRQIHKSHFIKIVNFFNWHSRHRYSSRSDNQTLWTSLLSALLTHSHRLISYSSCNCDRCRRKHAVQLFACTSISSFLRKAAQTKEWSTKKGIRLQLILPINVKSVFSNAIAIFACHFEMQWEEKKYCSDCWERKKHVL